MADTSRTETDIEVTIHHDTGRAILVSLDGDVKTAVWIPSTLIKDMRPYGGEIAIITIPEYLAIEKGLV